MTKGLRTRFFEPGGYRMTFEGIVVGIKETNKTIIAGSPPILLSLIVGKSKYDSQASVTPALLLLFPLCRHTVFHQTMTNIR